MTIVDVKIEIKNLETSVEMFYLKALMNKIKEELMYRLNYAPDSVVTSFEKIDITGEVIKE